MRAARISHVRSACEVGIGCARATNVYLVITGPSVLSTPAGVFTKDYFAFWIFIAVIWALVASFIIIALPIWESKDQILAVARCAHTTFSRRRGTHTVHYPHPHTPIARLRG